MHIGLIGLGKMGGNMRTRLRNKGIEVTGYARDRAVADVGSIEELVAALPSPKIVWVMVPHGKATDDVINELQKHMGAGDLIIEGGNSRFSEDIRHAAQVAESGIGYLDCGVSGGVWGLQNGYGLMVGGDEKLVAQAMPIFDALRPEGERAEGFVHVGDVGAGHYAKMVHNGIEYAMMQAFAEGYELLEKKDIIKDVHEHSLHGSVEQQSAHGYQTFQFQLLKKTQPWQRSRATLKTLVKVVGLLKKELLTLFQCQQSLLHYLLASQAVKMIHQR